MLFQSLDDNKFLGVYVSGAVYRDSIPNGLSKTWRYCAYLPPEDIIYANLYCGGKSLSEACPDSLSSEWSQISGRIKAHLDACRTAQVDLQDNSFFDLIPSKLLVDFCEIKNRITEHVLINYIKPTNYEFLCELEGLLSSIRQRKINLDLEAIKPHTISAHARMSYKKLKNASRVVDYDAFKSKTGRLTTKRESFPILTLNKQLRGSIKPNNDHFIELDFNAAELRTLLALSGGSQPANDIHEWNAENIYNGLTREEAKKRIFAWLYNPESSDHTSSKIYDREKVLQKYFTGDQVTTFFDRKIPADQHHALNYIIQSTTSDLLLKRAIEIGKLLQGKKSYIAFTLHDSVIVDYAEEDSHMLRNIVDTFRATDLGEYVVNVSVGDSFGTMKRLNL